MSLLSVSQLQVQYPIYGGILKKKVNSVCAVDGVSFQIAEGETLGLVGESGCGKSTIGKSIVRLIRPDSGGICFQGDELTTLPERKLRPYRKDLQMVFQDPAESLNPKMTVYELLAEPLIVHKLCPPRNREAKVKELLSKVGLPSQAYSKYSFEFSGGQRQRLGIARALAVEPKLIVLDEPVSALDLSVQAQVLNLLMNLQKEFGLSYLFIAHDLSVVKHMSDHVAVMYLGKIVEQAPSQVLYEDPRHAYTKALIDCIPSLSPSKRRRIGEGIQGEPPSAIDPPKGSAFGYRIGHAQYEDTIGLDLTPVEVGAQHFVAPDPCCVEGM